jgi:hypothetical protein
MNKSINASHLDEYRFKKFTFTIINIPLTNKFYAELKHTNLDKNKKK